MASTALKREAKSPETPVARLRELAELGEELARLVARNEAGAIKREEKSMNGNRDKDKDYQDTLKIMEWLKRQ